VLDLDNAIVIGDALLAQKTSFIITSRGGDILSGHTDTWLSRTLRPPTKPTSTTPEAHRPHC